MPTSIRPERSALFFVRALGDEKPSRVGVDGMGPYGSGRGEQRSRCRYRSPDKEQVMSLKLLP